MSPSPPLKCPAVRMPDLNFTIGSIAVPEPLKYDLCMHVSAYKLSNVFSISDTLKSETGEEVVLSQTGPVMEWHTVSSITHLLEQIARWIKDTNWDGQAIPVGWMGQNRGYRILTGGEILINSTGLQLIPDLPVFSTGGRQHVLLDADVIRLRNGRTAVISSRLHVPDETVKLLSTKKE